MTGSAPDPTASTVVEVVDLFGDYAHHRYDEVVSQMDHALQTAALARADGAPDVLVVASLLHDVGHLLELRDGGIVEGDVSQDLHHEVRGAAWLSAVFPPEVTRRSRCTSRPSATCARSTRAIGRTCLPDHGPAWPVRAAR